jgi:hypothetical protein
MRRSCSKRAVVRRIVAACKASCRIAYTQGERKPISLSETTDKPMLPRFKAAAVHAAPAFPDRRAITEKAISLICEAAAAGAGIVAFSKAFILAFPVWAASSAPIDNHDLFVRMPTSRLSTETAVTDDARPSAAHAGC